MTFFDRHTFYDAHGVTPYMTRYTLVGCRWFSLKLHHFHRGDSDPDFHDHPWPFVALILAGGYWELQPAGGEKVTVSWKAPGTLILHRAADAHRVVMKRPTWTLILCGPKVRDWGFHAPTGWCGWRTYVRGGRAACASEAAGGAA